MIKVWLEKDAKLTAQEVNAILTCAFDDATADGFVNKFVFERALYPYTYAVLTAKNGEENSFNDLSPLDAWNKMLLDGTIEKMSTEYETEIAILQDAATDVFDEYCRYNNSVHGITKNVRAILNEFAEALRSAVDAEQYKEIMDIASKWGLKEANAQAK